jgi:hypothetical protein
VHQEAEQGLHTVVCVHPPFAIESPPEITPGIDPISVEPILCEVCEELWPQFDTQQLELLSPLCLSSCALQLLQSSKDFNTIGT